ncbi:MAG: VacJ family lipoprotein [Burkholderiaceae bacterium]
MKSKSQFAEMMGLPWRYCRWVCATALLALLCGCASGPTAHAQDPLEPLNRRIFSFNEAVDRTVLKPVASAYKDAVPSPLRRGVSNFFDNLEDMWAVPNNVLQFKPQAAAESLLRVVINSTVGLVGLFDVASELGLERHPEDFGQTLGHWGLGAGPYLVLPLLGPSSARDAAGLVVDYQGDLLTHVNDVSTRNGLRVLNGVDTRSNYLNASKVMEEAALDNYSFTRETYIQRRRNAVYDGNPPDLEVDQ